MAVKQELANTDNSYVSTQSARSWQTWIELLTNYGLA